MPTPPAAAPLVRPRANWLWAELMQRSFGVDVLACPRCVGRFELIALIDDPVVIRRILSHLELPTDVPAARPARPPPLPLTSPDDVGAPALPVASSDGCDDDDMAVP